MDEKELRRATIKAEREVMSKRLAEIDAELAQEPGKVISRRTWEAMPAMARSEFLLSGGRLVDD